MFLGFEFIFTLSCLGYPYFLKKLSPDVKLLLKKDPVLGVFETMLDLPLIL
jgi:hypothetical protein